MKKASRKDKPLKLRTETTRTLTSNELKPVVGGAWYNSWFSACGSGTSEATDPNDP